ncbi:MAG: hypothetical protein GEV03_02390 [Streptosporangiales bacterium]|nr:hypothetical protein [Streptosporangiales bacterium]
MVDQFRADCEELIDLSNGELRELAENVGTCAGTISTLSTDEATWGAGLLGSVLINMIYEDVRGTFEKLQRDIAVTLNEVAVALRAVAENYQRVDEEIS